MILNLLNKFGLFILVTVVMFTYSCDGSGDDITEEEIEQNLEVEIDSTASTIVQYNNTLFSIPSPYEIGFLVKKINADLNVEMLNPTNKIDKYSNNFKKGINLGIYGADLGYLNVYEQIKDAASYFGAVKILSQELNISNAFDKATIEAVERNMNSGNKDSLMFIISNSYRKADQYLEDNNRENIGELILTGGWLESLYILTEIESVHHDEELVRRIAEQKHPLDNIIKILSPYYNKSDDYKNLIESFVDLAYDFDGIDLTYTYEEPEVFADKKLTIIKSKSDATISDEQLKTISEKVKAIRKSLID